MKKVKEIIQELNKTPRGKSILFFAGYFIFFLFLILLLNTNGNVKSSIDTSRDNKENLPFSLEVLKNNNFHFNYKITLDGVEYNYEGDKCEEVRKYTYLENEYLQENSKTYYYENEELKETTNPIVLLELVDEANLGKLLEASYHEAKTEYNSGKTTFWQLITADTINLIVYQKTTDIDSVPSRINVSTDENKEITGVSMVLDEYCKVSDICQNTLKIETTYTNIGKISKEALSE